MHVVVSAILLVPGPMGRTQIPGLVPTKDINNEYQKIWLIHKIFLYL